MRSFSIGHHDFAHDKNAIDTSGVRINGDRFQNAIGTASFRLSRGAPVETPKGEFFELREAAIFFKLSLATEVRDWGITIEPDVFELVFSHNRIFLWVKVDRSSNRRFYDETASKREIMTITPSSCYG